MKKTLIAAAVAGVSVLAAGGAMAQSTVTLYGRLNTTGEYQASGGKHTYQLSNNSSRFGFKGSEDLGSGLKAGFILESGFDSSTGAAATPFFGRQSEVNLSGSFGTVRLGNFQSEAYYATADYVSLHNHDTGTSSDALYAFGIGSRANKVAYRLPSLVAGLSVEGAVSAGEAATNTTRSYDGAINYTLGDLSLGLGVTRENKANQVAVRALYSFGSFLVGGYYQRDKNGMAQGTSGRFALDTLGTRNTYRLSGAYLLGANEFHINFGSAGDYSKRADSSAKQYTLAYNYNLSKRTKVYTYVTKIEASKNTGYVTDFSSIAFGLRHNF